VLGELDSSRVTLAIVAGIPAAIAVVVALGVRRRTPALLLLAGSLVVAGIVVLGGWAIFQAPAPQAAGSTNTAPGAGGPPGPPPSFSCTPSGTQLQQTASGIAFQKTCLAAPAGQPFTIQFDNKDSGTQHNIHILSADPTQDPSAESLFVGGLVTGPQTTTYDVKALPAGKLFFRCDVHPTQMFGGFVVAGT
jgi:hypothetical protein